VIDMQAEQVLLTEKQIDETLERNRLSIAKLPESIAISPIYTVGWQAKRAIELYCENERLKAALKIENETQEMVNPVIDSYVGELKATVAELTAIVEAYRLAGKWAEAGTDCHDCPVHLGTCGNNKKPACLHPSEYEAEWIAALQGEEAT